MPYVRHPHLCGGPWGLQDPVQGVEDVQDQDPSGAQQVMQPVCNVEQRAQRMDILGRQYHPL